MKDFITAALPWALMGLALAILAANHGVEAQKGSKRGERIAAGAGLGLLLGVTLNSCGLWENHVLGFVLGPLWGMALAALYKGEDRSQNEKET